jgi:hypothetical protein
MLKKLLYLYNDGHNPFPNMTGHGGLGYHLPQYHVRGKQIYGEGLHIFRDENGEIVIKDDNLYDPEHRFIASNLQGLPEGFVDKEETKELGDVINEAKKQKEKEEKREKKYNKKLKEGEKIIREIDKQLTEVNDYVDNVDNDKDENIQEEEFNKFIIPERIFNKITHIMDSTNNTLIIEQLKALLENYQFNPDEFKYIKQLIKKLKEEQKEEQKANQEKKELAKGEKKPLPFIIPKSNEEVLYNEEMINILNTALLTNEETEEFDECIEALNEIEIPILYDNAIGNKTGGYVDYINEMTIEHTVNDFTVIDPETGEKHKGKGGVDFELQVEHNDVLLDAIVKNTFGQNFYVVEKISQGHTGMDKSDLKLIIKDDTGQEYTVEEELKKFNNKYKFKKTYDLKTMNSIDQEYFKEWFCSEKKSLQELYNDCDVLGDFTDYIDLLKTLTTKNDKNKYVLDREKIKDKYGKSEQCLTMPLTLTKLHTPSKEQILEKHPGNNGLVKYLEHKSRINKTQHDVGLVYLIKDAILTDNTGNRFNQGEWIKYLKLTENGYGDKGFVSSPISAMGYPVCWLDVLPMTQAIKVSTLKLQQLQEKYLLQKQENKKKVKAKNNIKTK